MKLSFLLHLLLMMLCAPPLRASEADKMDKTEKTVLTVITVQPQSASWPRTLQAGGGIFAWQEAIVAAEIGGLAVTELPVDVGSVVTRGEELARLSDATIKAALAVHQANVTRAKAGLALAKANGARARAVKGSGALSDQQITQYLLGEESSQAELAAAQAVLAQEEVRLRQTRILAADDGVISARNATLGGVVQVGSELFRLVRQGRLEWRAELTASQLAEVKPGQQATLSLSNGQTTQATLRQIAPTQDPNSRKGLAYFDLPREAAAQAGMFAQGEIQLGEARQLTLPHSAIVHTDGHTYLFELTDGERVTRRKVTTGQRSGDRIAVLAGLEEQAKVVKSGGAFLKEGDRVRVTEDKP